MLGSIRRTGRSSAPQCMLLARETTRTGPTVCHRQLMTRRRALDRRHRTRQRPLRLCARLRFRAERERAVQRRGDRGLAVRHRGRGRARHGDVRCRCHAFGDRLIFEPPVEGVPACDVESDRVVCGHQRRSCRSPGGNRSPQVAGECRALAIIAPVSVDASRPPYRGAYVGSCVQLASAVTITAPPSRLATVVPQKDDRRRRGTHVAVHTRPLTRQGDAVAGSTSIELSLCIGDRRDARRRSFGDFDPGVANRSSEYRARHR